MKDLVAAERYAEALFEIAWRDRKDREYEEALFNLSKALKDDPAVDRFLQNPSVDVEAKKNCLKRIYPDKSDVSAALVSFFMLLLTRNRFGLVHEIATVFKKLADHAQGEGTAEIKSAVPLEPQAEARITAELERMAGYKLRVSKTVDPGLLGGVVVKMDYKIFDGSVINKIHRLSGELVAASSI